jgi:tRNA threonylcarbamoyladenosine biosynthesis protein TsaE
MGDVVTLSSHSPEDTEGIGRRIGVACRGGELIGLVGDLGAGKTCLVRGLAAGLGIPPTHVRSPSFTLIAEHAGRLPLFHIDLYRLDTDSVDELWLREYLFGPGVAAVEWFDRLPRGLTSEELSIGFDVRAGGERSLTVHARGRQHAALIDALM